MTAGTGRPDLVRRHLVVGGRVQGVAFRVYARAEAASLGLAGWVRNLPTGQVEVVAEGPAGAVEAFERWCHRGPPAARVTSVEGRTEVVEGLRGFAVRA